MLSKSKTRHAARAAQSDNAVTILTNGCHFSGKLYCRGATRIGGIIDGEIISEGVLVVEQDACIKANIRAEEVVVHGQVEGALEANSRVELCSSALFIGDIVTPSLVIKEGAQFNGRAKMNIESADIGHGGLKEDFEQPEIMTQEMISPTSGQNSPEVSVV